MKDVVCGPLTERALGSGADHGAAGDGRVAIGVVVHDVAEFVLVETGSF